jgi:PAS domain S-box-containing protein
MDNIIVIGVSCIALSAIAVLLFREYRLKKTLIEKDVDVRRKRYELAVLKRIGSKVGEELDGERMLELVTESLEQFLDYAVVSHVLVKDETYSFVATLKKPVSQEYLAALKEQTARSLEVLLDTSIKRDGVIDDVRGVFVIPEAPAHVRSYFNIPIILKGVVYGVLTISHFKEDAYNEEDMTILYKIVAQATQAVAKIEQVVKIEQSKLAAMIEGLHDGVFMVDRAFNVLVVNQAARQVLGVTGEGGVHFDDCIHRLRDTYDVRSFLEDSMTKDHVVTTREIELGERYYVMTISAVKANAEMVRGSILGGVVMFHDVTKEKEAEKLREDFSSVMIHELRSPLDGIRKISEMMHDDDIRTDKLSYDEYVKMIHGASSQMLELVNDLLDVARLENGSLDLSPRESKVQQVVGGRIRFFEIAAQDKKVALQSSIAPDVPEICQMDPIRIEQVLNNLLSNAIKYTQEGGAVSLDVFMHKDGENVLQEARDAGVSWFVSHDEAEVIHEGKSAIVFSVTDSGLGVEKERMGTLFQKFDRKDILTQNQKTKSLGLGLVIVKGIIERHGGVVGVASQEGEGSTFYFTIHI